MTYPFQRVCACPTSEPEDGIYLYIFAQKKIDTKEIKWVKVVKIMKPEKFEVTTNKMPFEDFVKKHDLEFHEQIIKFQPNFYNILFVHNLQKADVYND